MTRIEESSDVSIGPAGVVPIEMLEVRAVALRLKCSVRTVFRLAASSRMPPPVKLGALVRWCRSELEAWIASGCPTRQDGAP